MRLIAIWKSWWSALLQKRGGSGRSGKGKPESHCASINRDVSDLVVVVLDRPRHEKLINDIRAAGARIRLITDGDLSAGIAAAVIGTHVHAVMGTGGAPEGVITAAAMRCLNGEILARLVIDTPELEERIKKMGITNKNKIYTARTWRRAII